MSQIIIFPNDTGGVALCTPVPECGIPLFEIARKDVPAGRPFRIVNREDIPENDLFFAAFEADFSTPDGYGIGADAWFEEQRGK